MTVEYVLLLAIFTFMILGALVRGPAVSFQEAAPKLGARVENQLITGEGFTRGPDRKAHKWEAR